MMSLYPWKWEMDAAGTHGKDRFQTGPNFLPLPRNRGTDGAVPYHDALTALSGRPCSPNVAYSL
jgi:hypothetical protein